MLPPTIAHSSRPCLPPSPHRPAAALAFFGRLPESLERFQTAHLARRLIAAGRAVIEQWMGSRNVKPRIGSCGVRRARWDPPSTGSTALPRDPPPPTPSRLPPTHTLSLTHSHALTLLCASGPCPPVTRLGPRRSLIRAGVCGWGLLRRGRGRRRCLGCRCRCSLRRRTHQAAMRHRACVAHRPPVRMLTAWAIGAGAAMRCAAPTMPSRTLQPPVPAPRNPAHASPSLWRAGGGGGGNIAEIGVERNRALQGAGL